MCIYWDSASFDAFWDVAWKLSDKEIRAIL